jgi:ketosteroid isomerase-like protein
MNPNQRTLENFYAAFARLDPDGMAPCYADDALFDDEVFSLRGKREVMGMWRMLCAATRAKGADVWKLQYRDVQADGSAGRAHWDAHYRFSATGRIVDNSIDAQFEFDPAGQIVRHRDRFDFWLWSRQALGTPGLILGWTPMLRTKVRAQAQSSLRKFMANDVAASGSSPKPPGAT